MKVAMYYNNRDVRLEEMPRPSAGPGEILVKVRSSGICGSDVMEWYRIKKAPLVLGHEIAGDIVELGAGVQKYKVGQRVFVSHHIPCNTCRYCLSGHHTACETLHSTNFFPGGFAEVVRVPALNVDRGVFPLPDSVSYEEGSFIEPLACVVRAQRNAGLGAGQSVLILGSGISGLLHLITARALGAGRILATDVHPYRISFAKQLGADVSIDGRSDVPAEVRRANGGRPADLVILCTGARSAFDQAFQSVDRGGTILFFAPPNPGVEIQIPANEFWRNDIRMMPSYGNAPLDAMQAIELIRSKRVDVMPLVTHRLPLSKAVEGFRLVAEAGESVKVLLDPERTE
jgi:L-iditol 2-dehydrogenase